MFESPAPLSRATWLVAALLVSVACEGLGGAPGPGAAAGGLPGAPDAAWRLDPLWDDGRAEHCAYEVTWPRYGHLHRGRALLILVKEPWNAALGVKADEPERADFEVLKLNHLRDVPTGIYTYHQMASVFLRRDDGTLRMLTATSHEACGMSAARLAGGRLETRSYFESFPEADLAYPAGALPEDGLPAFLRHYVRGEPPATLDVFPELMDGRYDELEAVTYEVEKRRAEAARLPAGERSGVELVLRAGDRTLAYLFAPEPPHELLRLTDSRGTEYRLAKCERLPYWRLNRPGDEAWWPEGLRISF